MSEALSKENRAELDAVLEQLQQLPPALQQKLIAKLPKDEQETILEVLDELNVRNLRTKASDDFMVYVNQMWPNFIHGRHHEKMARAFERVARGEVKRLIINMPPRHTKSEIGRAHV